MKRLCSYRGLMGFIYALIMLLPFSSVLVRCLYVTFNKNAYQSYSASTFDTTTVTYVDSVENGKYYKFSTPLINLDIHNSNGGNRDCFVAVDNVQVIKNSTTYDLSSITFISFWSSSGSLSYSYYLWSSDSTSSPNEPFLGVSNGNTTTIELKFQVVSYSQSLNTFINGNDIFFTETLLPSSALDNAFDYSLYTFLEENGGGKLNLTDWFTDLFLNRSTHNMLYINYINWYMNYALLISCVYLLFLVLMWFVTLARRLLTSFEEKGEK